MSENTDRKVFPMTTFAAYLTGEDKSSNQSAIKDLLQYLTAMDIDSTSQPFAEAIARAWIYEQNPELLHSKDALEELGQHVSVPVLPEPVIAEVSEVVTALRSTQEKNAQQADKISSLEKELAEAQAALKEAEAKVSTYEAQLAEGEKKLQLSEGQIDTYTGKVDTLLAKIEEVIQHGVVTAAAGEGTASTGSAADTESATSDNAGEISDDFGFGTVSNDDDGGFGF